MIHPFLQRPLEMRETLPTAPELDIFADVVASLLAAFALLAGEADFEGDFVAGLEGGDGGAHGGDDAGGFVAEGEGLADEDVAVAEVGVVVEVAAAEACGGDVDLDFVGGGWGDLTGFLGSLLSIGRVLSCLKES